MKKNEIDYHGMIWEIPLERNLGYIYVKMLEPEKLGLDNEYCFLIKPLDLCRNSPISIEEIKTFENVLPLSYYLISSCLPRIRGEKKWNKIGVLPLLDDEKNLPEFKSCGKELEYSDWENHLWYVNKNLDPIDTVKKKFDKVKHVGLWQFTSPDLIRTKLTFFWIKKLGKNILNYYQEKEIKNDFWLNASHIETQHLIFYNEVERRFWNCSKS